LTVNFDGKL